MLKTLLSVKFPNVANISPCELSDKIKTNSNMQCDNSDRREHKTSVTMVILDVRSQSEYNVSHLIGSIRVDPSDAAAALNLIPDCNGHVEVICYCSMGYRSSEMVKLLQAMTKSDALKRVTYFNLEGGIFQWANESRPMEDHYRNPTVFAHPYSIAWQHFLKKALRKYDELT